MYVERETEKAYLLVYNAVSFWVQKRWYKNGKLLPAGWKSFRNAEKTQWQHVSFDALKEFEVMRKTEKAVLLRGVIREAGGGRENIQFWMPVSMANNWNYVARKVKEIEDAYPFIGASVIWSGNAA